MSIIKEILLNTGLIKPRTVEEFLPKHRELGFAYQALALTYFDSRRELERKPEEQEMVVDLMGRRIRERTLRLVDLAVSAAITNPYVAEPHHLEIGQNYMFDIDNQRLLIKKLKRNMLRRNVPDLEQAVEAPSEAWFKYGMEVADTLLSHLVFYGRLPTYLREIPLPFKG